MQRGRKPKPSKQKEITGNPGRRRPLAQREAKPRKPLVLPLPPRHLPAAAVEEWQRVVPRLFECGLLTDIDQQALAAYCNAVATLERACETLAAMAERDPATHGMMIRTTNGNAIQNPVLGTIRCAQHDVIRFAAEFGMTPSARSRINVAIGSLNPYPEEGDTGEEGEGGNGSNVVRGYFT